MRLSEIKRRVYYHVSDDPNLVFNPNHEFRHGELGRGFYITSEPSAWKDTLGKRKYLYAVDAKPLKIAKDFPGMQVFSNWAIEKGYMEMKVVKKPSGEIVYERDNVTPLVRPELTDSGKKFVWQDPMTGQQLRDLQNEYLKDHGYNAYEPQYSKEGHQIIVFDPSVIHLKRLK